MAEFAFCLFKYFPYGGLQQDLVRLAGVCLARGHRIKVYTGSWQGEVPAGLEVVRLPLRGLTNHKRAESFAGKLSEQALKNSCDAVVGFNKMPGLNIYFAADSCFAAKAFSRSFLYRKTPRCRTFMKLEKSVFENSANTQILLLSENEKKNFVHYYGTKEDRFHLLPPGISKDRLRPPDAEEKARQVRTGLGIEPDKKIVLMVGSGFRTKGVDRAIRAVSSLSGDLLQKTMLFIVGQDKPGPFARLARRLGIDSKVRFLGGRKDVPGLLWASNLLLHPAYMENTGTVLIEAMASGLPILATDVCGYSRYVEKAKAGLLTPSPFRQQVLNEQLAWMLTSLSQEKWGENGVRFVVENDMFGLHERAADIIEEVAR